MSVQSYSQQPSQFCQKLIAVLDLDVEYDLLHIVPALLGCSCAALHNGGASEYNLLKENFKNID